MMKAVIDLGHDVSFVTVVPPKPEAVAGLQLQNCWSLDQVPEETNDSAPLHLTPLQRRFASYWGVDHAKIRAVASLTKLCAADAVVADGLNVLPFLAGVEGACRVWFAADEWVWHHLSQLRLLDRHSWGNVKTALVKGLYERAYAPLLDRVWVVSEADRRAMRWIAGVRSIDVLPNGVDSEYYHPAEGPEFVNSCVFWGRLDFGPNIQALQWFCAKIWPALRRDVPDARLTIYGFKPTDPVRALAGRDGITLIPDLPDIRAGIGQHQVVILPFVSGGGVKSKLLEAFSMSKAVVGTPRSCNGLFGGPCPPLVQVSAPRDWVREIRGLWVDADRRQKLGMAARNWVLSHHTWEAAARVVLRGLEKTLAENRRQEQLRLA
jgi:glycosyltransferase involved in cell wall biosynthesis